MVLRIVLLVRGMDWNLIGAVSVHRGEEGSTDRFRSNVLAGKEFSMVFKRIGVFPKEEYEKRRLLFQNLEYVFPVRFEIRGDGEWPGLDAGFSPGMTSLFQPPGGIFCYVAKVEKAPAGKGGARVRFTGSETLDSRLRNKVLMNGTLPVPALASRPETPYGLKWKAGLGRPAEAAADGSALGFGKSPRRRLAGSDHRGRIHRPAALNFLRQWPGKTAGAILRCGFDHPR